MTHLLAFAIAHHMSSVYEVVSVEETSVFAGKLGRDVQRTAILKADGVNYAISLRGYHENCHPHPTKFVSGDRVVIFDGELLRVR